MRSLSRRHCLALLVAPLGVAVGVRAQPARFVVIRSAADGAGSRNLLDQLVRELRLALAPAAVDVVALDAGASAARLSRQLGDIQGVAIALGRQASDLIASMNTSPVPTVAGAISEPPGQPLDAISLLASPEPVVSAARELMPRMTRLRVVLDAGREGWFIAPAARACADAGIHLDVAEATDEQEAARAYAEVLRTSDGRTDTLWLLNNPRLVTRATVLPFLIEQSWRRSVPIVSQTLLHARAGALLALYPSPSDIAAELAGRARALAAGAPARPSVLARELSRAINRRTARRLGLLPSPSVLRRYSLVLPVR